MMENPTNLKVSLKLRHTKSGQKIYWDPATQEVNLYGPDGEYKSGATGDTAIRLVTGCLECGEYVNEGEMVEEIKGIEWVYRPELDGIVERWRSESKRIGMKLFALAKNAKVSSGSLSPILNGTANKAARTTVQKIDRALEQAAKKFDGGTKLEYNDERLEFIKECPFQDNGVESAEAPIPTPEAVTNNIPENHEPATGDVCNAQLGSAIAPGPEPPPELTMAELIAEITVEMIERERQYGGEMSGAAYYCASVIAHKVGVKHGR